MNEDKPKIRSTRRSAPHHVEIRVGKTLEYQLSSPLFPASLHRSDIARLGQETLMTFRVRFRAGHNGSLPKSSSAVGVPRGSRRLAERSLQAFLGHNHSEAHHTQRTRALPGSIGPSSVTFGKPAEQRGLRSRSLAISRSKKRKPALALALRDARSHYSKVAPGTAWSPLRSVQSLSKFFFITGSATTTAWYSHPYLLNLAAHVLHLDFKDSVTAFQTSFFSFLSLVFAIYSGNTMAFLYERQKAMVQNLYGECMALEELLEESVNTLGPDARDILAQIRVYIDTEIYHPENQSPPLGDGYALSIIRSKARNYRRAGTDVGDILHASQRLAHAQSERQATACRLLPPVHWALLYTIGALFVSTFILFETGGSFSNEGRHILFTVLCGLMSFVLVALRDLADPAEGVYNATALLETRLSYVKMMLDKYQKLPSSRPMQATGPSASLAVTGPEELSGSTLLSSVVSAIKHVATGEEAETHAHEEKRQDPEAAPENGSHPRGRPVLEAKLQVSTPEAARSNSTAPAMPGGGVTASLGVGRPTGNTPAKTAPGPPHLNGLPPNAPQSGVSRLVGVSSSIVSRPKKVSPEEQFRKHLAHRGLEHESAGKRAVPVQAGGVSPQAD